MHPSASDPRRGPQPVGALPAQSVDVDTDVVRAALTGVLDTVLVVDQATDRIVYASQACFDHFGYRVDELIGQQIELLVPAPLTAAHRNLRASYVGSPVARPMDQRGGILAVRKDGTVYPVQISLAAVTTPRGSFVTAVVRDDSAQQEARRLDVEARRRAEHLALSQQVAGMGSWEENHATGHVRWSDQLYRILGLAPGQRRPGMATFMEHVHPDDLPELATEVARSLREGGRVAAEVRLVPAEVRLVPAGERIVALLGTVETDSGRPVRTVGTVQDVTSQRTLERRLMISQGRFAAAFDAAPTGMAIIDAGRAGPPRIVAVNDALAQLTGVPVGELVGRPATDIPQEGQLRRLDGTARWVSVSSAPVHDLDGTADYRVVHVLDLTDRERAHREERALAARDARIAAVLQDALLPYVPRSLGPIRVASRYRAAGQGEAVGGDWADVFALPNGHIGLVVGDVAGHGIEAAATMTRLRTLVRMLATGGVGPAGMMSRLNDAVNDAMDDGDLAGDVTLATLVHAQLDPATGRLVYSSAGHLPLLYSPDRSHGGPRATRPLAVVGGPPIGAVPGLQYAEHAVRLEPGCRLLGFTDGLVETRAQPLDENLLTLITGLSQVPEATAADVELLADHALDLAPGDGRDDIALLVVGFEPDPDETGKQPADRQRAQELAGCLGG